MTSPDPSREAFENWIHKEFGEIVSLTRLPSGKYEDPEACCFWVGWQAACIHKKAPASEEVRALPCAIKTTPSVDAGAINSVAAIENVASK